MVPRRGLEPPRLAALVPETSASTNSAIWAKRGYRGPRRGPPARSCGPSATHGRGRPDSRRAGKSALSGFGAHALVEGYAHAVINARSAVLAPGGASRRSRPLHVRGRARRRQGRTGKPGITQRLVHISAIGADRNARPRTTRAPRAAGEQAVLAAVPNAIILRPSIVFGPEDQFFNRFAAKWRGSVPFLPLIGGAATRCTPIYVGDRGGRQLPRMPIDGKPAEGGNDLRARRAGDAAERSASSWIADSCNIRGRNRPYLPSAVLARQAAGRRNLSPLPNSVCGRSRSIRSASLQTGQRRVGRRAQREGRTLAALRHCAVQRRSRRSCPMYLERFKPRGQYAHYRNS
jgi:hypothetical protein